VVGYREGSPSGNATFLAAVATANAAKIAAVNAAEIAHQKSVDAAKATLIAAGEIPT